MSHRHLSMAAVLVLLPAAALAYVRTPVTHEQQPVEGTCLYWSPRTLQWSPAPAPDGSPLDPEVLDQVRASFAEWEAPGCSDLRFEEGPQAERSVGYAPDGPNENVVVFHDDRCERSDPCHLDFSCDCWNFSQQMIAVTTTTFRQCTGEIVDADIEVNGADFRLTWSDEPSCPKVEEACAGTCSPEELEGCVDTDLRNTLVHEVGHLIGLDHSPEIEATMYAQAARGETLKRDLHEDDVEGLCAIYPAGEKTWICEPAPFQGCKADASGLSDSSSGIGCAAAGGGLGSLWVWAALGWLGWRRRPGLRQAARSS